MRAPDIEGPRARGWRLSAASKPAALAIYLVHYPGAHQLWDCWMVATCHLRPVEGMPPPVLHFPEATHEVQFLALDPEHMPVPNPEWPPEGLRFLTPIDLVWQGEMTDDEAERLVQDAVKVMCKVGPPPESDYAAWWRRALPNTLEHYRTGGHDAARKGA